MEIVAFVILFLWVNSVSCDLRKLKKENVDLKREIASLNRKVK